MTILENNAMQSTASSAGYSTGGTMVSAIAAMLIVQGHHIPWPALVCWTFFLAVLGTVMAIPMKRQMINIEQLKFPSGMAAAETLRSLYGAGDEARRKARALFGAMGIGAVVTWLRDAHAVAQTGILSVLTKLSRLPALVPIPGLTVGGVPAQQYTIALEGSLILVAAGGLMGLRTTASMFVASLLNYGVLAPWIKGLGGIERLGYRGIVSWSLWPGAAIMVTSGLLSFGLQWRTVARAFSGLGKIFVRAKPTRGGYRDPGKLVEVDDPMEAIEVPPSWFAMGMAFSTVGLVLTGWLAFGIPPVLGVVAVALSFVLAIVACRATGETDTTPVGAMGKITQLTFGVLVPGNAAANLMTATVTAGAAAHSADLLTEVKTGYLLGGAPRRQFWAQILGVVAGGFACVLAYSFIARPERLGNELAAPAAVAWASVAKLLKDGPQNLPQYALHGIVVGAVLGAILAVVDEYVPPRIKRWLPSATGLGIALVIDLNDSLAMLVGALAAWALHRYRAELAERYTVSVSSGMVAGEGLMGIGVIVLRDVLHWLPS